MPIGLLCIGWICSHHVSAQYRFDSWTTNDGLPQNGIRGIAQTPDGYLWFTTFDGLVRFDGVRFTVFDHSNTKGIESNRFASLAVDKEGTLFAPAPEDGVVTVYRDGVFTSYTPATGLPGRSVYAYQDSNGEALLLCDGKAAYYLRDGKFIFHSQIEPDGKKVFITRSGAQWTITQNQAQELRDGRVMIYPLKLVNKSVRDSVEVYEDRLGNLWLADISRLYCLRDGQIKQYGPKDGLPVNTIMHDFWEDSEGSLWCVTGDQNFEGAGVIRFKDGRFKSWGAESGLSNDRIFTRFIDREGTVWLATNKGLNRLRRQPITAYSTADGLLHNEVYPILQTRDGDIWVGSIAGLNRFRDGRFTKVPLPASWISTGTDYQVQALYEDPTGRLWIGMIGGLWRYENGKLEEIRELSIDPIINAICSDREGTVWLATNKGLVRFNGERMTAHYTTRDGLPSDDVKVIHEDRSGNLWFGTYGGITQFKDGKFINYTAADGLTGNRVRSIYEDSDGVLWVGTYDEGLSRFKDGRFTNYKVDQGLFSNGVFCILEDRHGRFWISSNKGIYRVSKRELNDFAQGRIEKINCVAYGKDDGMLNTECNGGRQPAGVVARDGKFWFPTIEGVAVVDPEAEPPNEVPPPVLIENVRLDRSRIDFSGGLTIEPGQDDLEISYAGLSFIKSEQAKFKYKLEGLDTDWTDAGTRRVAYYPYLPPGEYTFRVIAANADGVWNTEGAQISIKVLTPFYQRLWFLLGLGVAGAAVAFLLLRARIAQLKRKQAAQEAFSRQLIESQEQERKRIAAELHDSIGQSLAIIKSQALFGLHGPLDEHIAREQLQQVAVHTTQAIEEVRHIAHNLRPYLLDRLGLTRAIEAMMKAAAASCPLEFSTEIENVDGLLPNDAEINLYRIVQEAVNNIIKHSEASRASVAIFRTAAGLTVTIGDNGKGFALERAAAPENGDQHPRSFGLIGMAERARMLNGKYSTHSAPGQGTTVTVTIPLKRQWKAGKDEGRDHSSNGR